MKNWGGVRFPWLEGTSDDLREPREICAILDQIYDQGENF